MSKDLCFDPITGASGDMILGALFDIGVPVDLVDQKVRSTGLSEFELSFDRITDHTGITAGRCSVTISESHHHRKLPDIEKIINSGDFSDDIKEVAIKIFTRLAKAEAKVHNISIDKVHFHEVGAVDAIVDILGAAIGIEYLKPEKIYCSPLKIGRGTVKCAHGIMPVPAPATAELIKGFPVIALPIDTELTTPTGAAILTTISEGDFSNRQMIIKKIGYGLGQKEFENRTNAIRIMEVEFTDDSASDEIDIIETDIDDESPEITASIIEKLLESGAIDASIQPVVMKKGRTGSRLTILSPNGKTTDIANCLFIHSSTIGVRIHSARRIILPRSSIQVKTRWGEVTAKKITRPDRIEIVPEFEICRKIADENNISIREVMQEVIKNA
ncbi:MAG: nickel pincer cofactor biosynthesis protein LarC [candidate division Zixibacteria bacterium]|nr:nickel pincer cofactor biosynthesis protein LarC [candidate division Zixibacteria bacterium]